MSFQDGLRDACARFGVKEAAVTTELQEHQKRVRDKLLQPDQPGLVAMHGLGSGKTLTAIAAQDALGLPADVVTPAALQANYAKELQKHTDAPPDTNLRSMELVARGAALRRPFLVVDEAHRSRNPTKTQQALKRTEAKKRLLLTGSLFYNAPSDAAGPINLVAGANVLPADPDEFMSRFVKETRDEPGAIRRFFGAKPTHTVDVNPAQREHLQNIFRKYVDYHPSNRSEFPGRTDETITVPMTSHQQDVYDTLIGEAPEWVDKRIRSGLPPSKAEMQQLNRYLQGVRQVSNSTAPYESKGTPHSPKIERAFEELKKHLAANERAKAVVYSNYLDAGIAPYKALLDREKIPYGQFTGAMPRKQREQLVKDYNDNKLRVLLLSRAGGEGLDLQGTRLMQLLEPHWNEEGPKQVIGRGIRYRSHAHLPEDERSVHVQRFLASRARQGLAERLRLKDPESGVDAYLQDLAQRKEDLNQKFRNLLREA